MKNKEPKGIGGWMWLPIIGFIINIIVSLWFVYIGYVEVNPGSLDIFIKALLGNIAINALLLGLIFVKKPFVRYLIAGYFFVVAMVTGVLIPFLIFPFGTWGAIWCIYFYYSRRVKNTYTDE